MTVRRRPQVGQTDLCTAFCSLYIAVRGLSTSNAHRATGGSNNATPNPVHSAPPGTTKRAKQNVALDQTKISPATRKTAYIDMTAAERAAAAKVRADEVIAKQAEKQRAGPVQGGLAKGNIFEEDAIRPGAAPVDEEDNIVREDRELSRRSPANMAPRLDPNPNARARWTRMMIIRNIRRRGRLTRVMRIARTERQHLSKSRFFETSIKKLAPLARQIAGKSLDEAILQMRFSSKKAAIEVRKHLIQARNEAIVQAGMGLPNPEAAEQADITKTKVEVSAKDRIMHAVKGTVPETKTETETVEVATQTSLASHSHEIVDPSNTPALPTQQPNKLLRRGVAPNPTDMYIAQAWVNRGAYEREASPRARGRTDILRHPHTGISVLLKEEKTRSREKQEKEIKAIRKRLNGKLWTQMPDRPITRQSQYVLW